MVLFFRRDVIPAGDAVFILALLNIIERAGSGFTSGERRFIVEANEERDEITPVGHEQCASLWWNNSGRTRAVLFQDFPVGFRQVFIPFLLIPQAGVGESHHHKRFLQSRLNVQSFLGGFNGFREIALVE